MRITSIVSMRRRCSPGLWHSPSAQALEPFGRRAPARARPDSPAAARSEPTRAHLELRRLAERELRSPSALRPPARSADRTRAGCAGRWSRRPRGARARPRSPRASARPRAPRRARPGTGSSLTRASLPTSPIGLEPGACGSRGSTRGARARPMPPSSAERLSPPSVMSATDRSACSRCPAARVVDVGRRRRSRSGSAAAGRRAPAPRSSRAPSVLHALGGRWS